MTVAGAKLTIELLEDSVNGTRAAAAAHADIELVGVVLGHFVYSLSFIRVGRGDDFELECGGLR